MNILITGGAGFIGSNLVAKLEKKHNITVIDRKNGIDLLTSKIPNGKKFDVIIHEAAITDTTFKPDNQMINENVLGFWQVLKIATHHNADVVYASSASVYGNGKTPMKECQILYPLNAYARSKCSMEMMALSFNSLIKIVGLRYFNVFGPGEANKGHSASMIYHLRKQLLDGKNPRLFKYGKQKRDHIYVKDIVSATIKAMKAKSGIYNVGTGKTTSFNDLLKIISKQLNIYKKTEFIDNPYKDSYQSNTQADLTKTKKCLKWEPEYSLKDGIKDYYRWLDAKK